MSRKLKKCLRPRRGLLIAMTALLVTLVLYFVAPDPFELAELRLLDFRTRLRGPKPPGDLVKLILIDAEAREKFGLNERMRFALAGILSDICRQKVRAIGLDFFFVPIPEPEEDQSRSVLAEAVAACENVAMGYAWGVDLSENRPAKAEALGRRRLLDATRNAEEEGFTPDRIPGDAVAPDPFLTKNAAAVGFFSVVADPFNQARKIPGALEYNGSHLFPFSLAIVRASLQEDYTLKKHSDGMSSFTPTSGTVKLRPDPSGYLWLNHYGTASAFETLHFSDVAKNGLPEGFADNAIILIGSSGEGSDDLFATTFDPELPGVVLHATAVANALSDGFLWRDQTIRALEVAIMALCALLMGLLLPRLTPSLSLALGPFLALVLWIAADMALARFAVWLQLICPMLLILLAHIGILAARMRAAEAYCAIFPNNVD